MKKMYQLTAHNLKHGYKIENRTFTSKKIAMLSFQRLINYLNFNHNLNKNETQIITENNRKHHLVLDHQFAVNLETLEVTKKVCEYI